MAAKIESNIEDFTREELEEFIKHIKSNLTFKSDTLQSPTKEIQEYQVVKDVPSALKNIEYLFGVYYPKSVDEVKQLVNYGRLNKKIVRCKGAGHSPKSSIFSNDGIDMVLRGELREVKQIKKMGEGEDRKAIYKVGGGCNMGVNPLDLTSTLENSLTYQLDQQGYGMNILGGISQQTISGFMLTGSSGGSIKYGFPDSITEIQFVNGKGELKTVTPEVESDLFYAVGVSIGLFGIVVSVSIEVVAKFNVEGTESNLNFADSLLEKGKLIPALTDVPYFHGQWLPQAGVNIVDQFVAKKGGTRTIPYIHPLGKPINAILSAVAFAIIDQILINNKTISAAQQRFIALLLKPFLPVPSEQNFCDAWYKVLPNDDAAPVDTLDKVNFMEMWFPINFADELISILQNKTFQNPKATGNITTEIYGSKASPFWLSPSYQRDVVRLDKLRWFFNIGSPRDYYEFFWEDLMGAKGMRFHWGKWMPENGQTFNGVTFNLQFLKNAYPKLEEWLALREQMDPEQVFVSQYWRSIFEIKEK